MGSCNSIKASGRVAKPDISPSDVSLVYAFISVKEADVLFTSRININAVWSSFILLKSCPAK